MEPKTRHLFKMAKADLEFRQILKDAGEKHHTPRFYWDTILEITYAAVYIGYLIGKGWSKTKIYSGMK